jgi:pimeloyl-ACP methyl ester carboxylesterase
VKLLQDVAFVEIKRDGAPRLCVSTLGEGPLILMVHGFPESWYSWRHQMAALAAAGFKAAALHVRGYGQSDKPEPVEAYAITELADDIAATIDVLGGPAILVGHDWGSPQVAAAAILHPSKVRGLVTLSVPIGPYIDRKPSDIWAESYPNELFYHSYFQQPGVAEAEFEGDLQGFLIRFFHAWGGERPVGRNAYVRPGTVSAFLEGIPIPGKLPAWLSQAELDHYIRDFSDGGLRGPLNRYRAQDLDIDLMRPFADRTIDQPSLFVAGSLDPVRELIPGHDRYRAPMGRCTDCRGMYLIDGAGHWLQQERPAAVNAHLLDFARSMAATRHG